MNPQPRERQPIPIRDNASMPKIWLHRSPRHVWGTSCVVSYVNHAHVVMQYAIRGRDDFCAYIYVRNALIVDNPNVIIDV